MADVVAEVPELDAPAVTPRPRQGRPWRALRSPQYRLYFVSGLGMTGAQGVEALALSWLVLDITGSVAQLGFVIFARGLPMAIVALFGGVLADRHDRRRLLIYTQTVMMVNYFLLAALTIGGVVQIWEVYVASLIAGVAWSLSMPARQALVRSLVDESDLMSAVALNSTQQTAARIIWPTMAGGLIAIAGVGVTIVLCGLCYLVGLVFISLMRVAKEDAAAVHSGALREVVEGLRYTLSDGPVGTVILMSTLMGMSGLAYQQLAPAFGREVLGLNAARTGLFLMSAGLGSILGSIVLLAFEVRSRVPVFMAAITGYAVALLLIGLTHWTPGSFFFMAVFGICNAPIVIVGQTIFQVRVPDRLLGRVMSLWHFGGGLGFVSALPLGLAGDAFGLRWAIGGVAAMLLAMSLLVSLSGLAFREKAPVEATS